jgi:hypothetical protein
MLVTRSEKPAFVGASLLAINGSVQLRIASKLGSYGSVIVVT